MALRPKVKKEDLVPRPAAEATTLRDASGRGVASTTMLFPETAGLTRGELEVDTPFTKEDLFFDPASGQVDPRLKTFDERAAGGSVTLRNEDIARVRARREAEATPRPRLTADAINRALRPEVIGRAAPEERGIGLRGPEADRFRAGAGAEGEARPAVSAANPTGRPMSQQEEFTRNRILRNPFSVAPAERNRVMAEIATEKREAARAEATAEAKAQREAAAQAEIDAFREQERVKADEAIRIAEAEAGFAETAAEAEATREETRAKADFERKKKTITAQSDADIAKKDAEMQAKGEVVGSDNWLKRKQQEVKDKEAELMSKYKLDEKTAKREAVISVIGSMFRGGIPPSTDAIDAARNAVAAEFGEDVPDEITQMFGEGLGVSPLGIKTGDEQPAPATPEGETAPLPDATTPADVTGDGVPESPEYINKALAAVRRVPMEQADQFFDEGRWDRAKYDKYLEAVEIDKAWRARIKRNALAKVEGVAQA